MFENLVASIAPKSFNLERYLAKSKQLTKITTKTENLIRQYLKGELSYRKRFGEITTAVAYDGTIVSIDNEELSKGLYNAVTSEGFNEKLSITYSKFKCFKNMKFFINKKLQQVAFVYYGCELDRSKDFLRTIYDSLNELISLFSTDGYTIKLNYYKLFQQFLSENVKTSFLTAFFTSMVSQEYAYSIKEMDSIVWLLLNYDNISEEICTQIPGMYLNHVDKFFDNSYWPRNIRLNILNYLYNKGSFSSYSDLFEKYDNASDDLPLLLHTNANFVFDEDILKKALVLGGNSEEFETYMIKESQDSNNHFVVKVKDLSRVGLYSHTLNLCTQSGFLDSVYVVPNAMRDTVYLFFTTPNCLSLRDTATSSDCARVTSLMQTVSQKKWFFGFKDYSNLLSCFLADDSKIYLNPLYIDRVAFEENGKNLDYKLMVLNIVEAYVKSKNIKVDNIYNYSFMKILPPNFARNIINYLENGTVLDENTDDWGDVLTFSEISNIRFVHNLSRVNPDLITFFPVVHSDCKVKEIVSRKSMYLENDFINSPECLQYISDIGLSLTDDILAKIFESNQDFFLHPVKVIVSKDLCISNSYQIVGVVWNKCGLNTIGDLIKAGKVDAIVFYKLLSSLLQNYSNHNWRIDENNVCQMLADKDYNVFLNHNALTLFQNNGEIRRGKHFEQLFDALNAHRNTTIPFQRFSYGELYDSGRQMNANKVLLCDEHNLYYIEGSLCPECRKIYCVINKFSYRSLYGSSFWYYCSTSYKNSLIGTNAGTTLYPWVIKQCKLGIEKGLFNKFFFKPDSLALQQDKVIGVVYFEMGRFNFDNLLPISIFEARQRLQVMLVMYKKLLPFILDGSCISDQNAFFDSIAMHKDYKGELFILQLPFMNCEAIVAKDKDAMDKTKLTFSNFLISYIKADPCLNAATSVAGSEIDKLIQDIKELKFTQTLLEECITAFCNVHNTPFSSKNTLCPFCIADGINADDVVVLPTTHFQQLQKGSPMFEGGEATLYVYAPGKLQKLFKPGVDLVFKSKIIGKALQRRIQFKAFNAKHTDIKFITIDKVLYESSGNNIQLKGFVQEDIEDSFKISSLKDKEFVSSHGYTRQDVIDILIKVCIGIEFLHSIGGYIGDLNGGNILIRDKNVYFIDMDGMSFDNVRNYVYTDMYIYPPSAESKNITKDDDWYSLAIQAFYYFTYSHPFRGISDSKLVPTDEITRMKVGMSVLGNYGIKVPNISIGWQFMPKKLILFFKGTFEGNKRESMRSVLEHFKTHSSSLSTAPTMKFSEVKRSSPCHFALSFNTYIDTSGNLIWKESKLLHFSSGTISCKVTGEYIILTTPNNSVVLNDTTGHYNVYSALSKNDNLYASNDKLYYISGTDNTVHVRQIDSRTGKESDELVVHSSTLVPIDFLVTDERKFIFLVSNDDYVSIYCNLEELTSVDISNLDNTFESHLSYDNESGSYLILLSGSGKTLGVLISSNGTYSTFNLNEEVSTYSCFYKNTLYYMINDTIYFYNVVSGKQNTFTSQITANNCLIERKENKFVICSNDKTYMYVKS